MTSLTRKYGVSVVSLFPWSWGPGGLQRAVSLAGQAGYDGVQALPLRGWDFSTLNQYADRILAYEDAWNSGPLWRAIGRHLRLVDPRRAPTLLDWLLFARLRMPAVSGSMQVSHVIGSERGPIEIHAELSTSLDFYRAQRGGLCWDTLHVRRPHRWTDESMPDWRDLLKRLPANAIQLIHVHPNVSEVMSLGRRGHESSELADMLKALRDRAPDALAIVEVAPRLYPTPGETAMFAKHLREAVSQHLDR